ncbi:MAG: MBL fold metallo-hydrolase [Lentisphaeria bacterium]
MKIDKLVVGMLEVNCYLVWNQDTGDGFIIDPGSEAEMIADRVDELGFKPRGILLTHGHVDHILAVPELASKYGISVRLQPDEESLYFSPQNELPPWLPPAEKLPSPEDVRDDLEGLCFTVYPTPGHTRGGCSYFFAEDEVVFTGDTLFCGGVGRTDLPGGDHSMLLNSIRDKLLTLPEKTVVYPGHGPKTTIEREANDNPFL